MEAVKEKSQRKKENVSTLDPPPEIDLSDLVLPKDDSNNNSSSKIDNNRNEKIQKKASTDALPAAIETVLKEGKKTGSLDNVKIYESVSTPNTCEEKHQEDRLPISTNSLPTIRKDKIKVEDHKLISQQPLKVQGEVKWKRNATIPTAEVKVVPFAQLGPEIKLGRIVEQTANAKLEPQLQSAIDDNILTPQPRVDTTSGHVAYLRALQRYWRANEKLTEIRKQMDCISIHSENDSKKVANSKKGWKRIFRRPKAKTEELTSHVLLTSEAYKGEKAAIKELRLATLELQRTTQNCIPTPTTFEQRVSSKPSNISNPWEDSNTAEVVSVDYLWNLYEGLNQLINPCPVEGKMSVVTSTETAKNLGYSSEGRRMFFDKLQLALFDISQSLNFLDAYRCFLKHLHLQTSLAKASKPTEYSVSGFDSFEKHFSKFVTSVGKLKALITLPTQVDKIVESGIQVVKNTLKAKQELYRNHTSSAGSISSFNSQVAPNRQEFISKLYKPLDGNFFKQLQSNIRSMDVHVPRSESQFWKIFATPDDIKILEEKFAEAVRDANNLCVDSTWNLYEKSKQREVQPPPGIIVVQEPIILPYSWDYLSRLIATKSQTELLNLNAKENTVRDDKPTVASWIPYGPFLRTECPEGILIPPIDKRSKHSHRSTSSKRYRNRSPPPPPEHLLEWQFRFPKAVAHEVQQEQHSSGKRKHGKKVKHKHKTLRHVSRAGSKSVIGTDDNDQSEEPDADEVKPSTALQNVSAEIKYWARRKTRQLTNATNRVIGVLKRS